MSLGSLVPLVCVAPFMCVPHMCTSWLKDMAETAMFHQKSQPKLQGKAVEVRDLGPVLGMVWEKHMNPNLDIHRRIHLVLTGFSKSQTLNPNFFLVFKVLST